MSVIIKMRNLVPSPISNGSPVSLMEFVNS